jgi:hypothetical protein
MSTQLQMGYLAGETLHHVPQTQVHVCENDKKDYMKSSKGGAQEQSVQ